ncbi:multiple epidermal growth factor-like domains 10 [Plakobranchus ocellatus]|uniref:Multiple epidermal growth factor-like domains 10 n=1 Tax=Plakobranchus ocellatus TaxID=259542 RepID=A0AAV3XV83_9GAST|nr:multiple epidermal growth factor-like domains 10 [Plakobranchus ocellatus]
MASEPLLPVVLFFRGLHPVARAFDAALVRVMKPVMGRPSPTSAGHNLALRGNASQSSKVNEMSASQAVDGKFDKWESIPTAIDPDKKNEAICSRTLPRKYDNSQTWTLTFKAPVVVSRVVIWNWWKHTFKNSNAWSPTILKHYILEFYDRAGYAIDMNQDRQNSGRQNYTFMRENRIQNVKTIKIRGNYKQNYLHLCEVQVFGSHTCPDGKFGLECENTCNCAKEESCFIHSGGCPSGCRVGYKGENCFDVCPSGTYGKDCKKKCSKLCAGEGNICDHVNGTCVRCKPGRTGPRCETVCHRGTYGMNCKDKCSENCVVAGSICDHVQGTCVAGCVLGFKGSRCDTVCHRGTYGMNCKDKCSENCVVAGSICDHVQGTCVAGCVLGFKGSRCDTGKTTCKNYPVHKESHQYAIGLNRRPRQVVTSEMLLLFSGTQRKEAGGVAAKECTNNIEECEETPFAETQPLHTIGTGYILSRWRPEDSNRSQKWKASLQWRLRVFIYYIFWGVPPP